jgi:membrane-associated phospholipid phosphatase
MKRQISKFKSGVLWTIIPAILWLIMISARPVLLNTQCAQSPQTCTKESIFSIDRLSFGMEDSQADHYSFLTQNTSGVWAATLPILLGSIQIATGGISSSIILLNLAEDSIALLQVISWNGFLTEVSHWVSQRPRPFVYSNPAERGIDSAHYTSFYSGHTSFSAAANTAAFLILVSRNAPFLLLLISFVSAEALVFSTAYFRILAGRHFLTDVICGAIAGTLVAFVVLRKRKTKWLS